jgi:hypothetical protein
MIGQPGLEPLSTLRFWPCVLTAAGRSAEARQWPTAPSRPPGPTAAPTGSGPHNRHRPSVHRGTSGRGADPPLRQSGLLQPISPLPLRRGRGRPRHRHSEAVHGSRESGLELFEATIDTLPRGAAPQPGRDPGQPGCLFRPNRPSRSGCHLVRDATRSKSIAAVPGRPATVEHLRAIARRR